MHRSTVIFLILLRLAIGWHFLVEGYYKIQSQQIGETVTNRPFTSAVYFREAPGPLGAAIRRYAGDPDHDALARLSVQPIPEGKDPATIPPQQRVPAALKADWSAYLYTFAAHYTMDAKQRQQAEAALDQASAKAVEWLTYQAPANPADQEKDPRFEQYTSEHTRTYPSGEVKRRLSMADRLAEYRGKLADLKAAARTNWEFGRDVEGARVRQTKADIARLRLSLLADLDRQTEAYHTALEKVLTPEQLDQGPVVAERKKTVIDHIDRVTPFALAGMGLFLMIGLFTRTAAVLAAGFLLMTILTIPSLPWLPAPPQNEGNYLVINKNVVEMLALLVLASLPTGRWFGLDAILSAVGSLFRRRRPEQA